MATSALMVSKIGWKEIGEDTERFQTSSDILKSVDYLGYIFGSKKKMKGCDEKHDNFPTANIQLVVENLPAALNEDEGACFSFEGSGSICLPPIGNHGLEEEECYTHVSTLFKIADDNTDMFPTNIHIYKKNMINSKIGNNLVGLTIENNTMPINLPNGSDLIIVTIFNEKVEVRRS